MIRHWSYICLFQLIHLDFKLSCRNFCTDTTFCPCLIWDWKTHISCRKFQVQRRYELLSQTREEAFILSIVYNASLRSCPASGCFATLRRGRLHFGLRQFPLRSAPMACPGVKKATNFLGCLCEAWWWLCNSNVCFSLCNFLRSNNRKVRCRNTWFDRE